MLVPVFEISTFFIPKIMCYMTLLGKLDDGCFKNVSEFV